VHVGPLNPIDGFPEYVSSVTNGRTIAVQRCLDPVFCFASPVIPSDPFSVQIGSGPEAFYWSATNTVFNAGGNRVLTYVAAAEAAFLQIGPNGEPIDGAQFAFLRLRFTMGVPTDGTYTVQHPYGTDTFKVTGATGARDVFFTIDKGLTPNSDVVGAVGGFLYADPQFTTVPAGFLGDGGVAAAPVLALGSPCNWNSVQITGVDTAGNPVDFSGAGLGETTLLSDQFTIQGQIYDGRVQTALDPTRLTYSRGLTGAGQIDGFAASTSTATVTLVDGPTIPAASGRIAAPVKLDRVGVVNALGQTVGGIDSTSVPVADASALPPIVAMTAAEPGAAPVTDPTTLNLHLVDFVNISQADYDPATRVLSVAAASGDLRGAPTLTLRDLGTFTPGQALKLVSTVAPPAVVHVDSSAGGTSSAQVRVIASAPPAAPTALALRAATALTLTLNWADNSANESGFQVYTVAADGSRTLVATVAANATAVTLSGLAPATSYTVQVDAFNASGASSSTTLVASTLALPAAPSGVAAALSTTATRAINVSWVDNSADETGFAISRSTTATGTYVQVGTAAAGATSYTDVAGTTPPAPGATYFYRVVALRGTDTSPVAQTAAGLATPTAPTSTTAPTFSSVGSSSLVVNWSDRSTNEAGFQVYRRTGLTGAFGAVSAVLPTGNVAGVGVANAATTYTDTTVAAGTQYFYRVDVSNWAGAVQSAVSLGVTTPQVVNLAAPTSLAASVSKKPVLTWVDAAAGETAYRASRAAITVNATNGSVTAGTATIVSSAIAANAATFTDTTGLNNDVTVRYDVAALNGATPGTGATVYTTSTALPAANTPTLARSLVGVGATATARVTLTWTALTTTATIGGYEIQRCAGTTCTNFVKVTGSAVNTAGTVDGRATVSFQDNSVARGTAYRYRMRTVGGAGTGLVSTSFSGNAAVTTQ
jgi:hypothetical protein